MITQNDVVAAIVTLLEARYPGETVYSNLVPKGFVRPAFLVENQDFRMAPAGCGTADLRLMIHLACFVGVDDYHDSQLSALNVRQLALMGLFAVGYLRVKDRALHVAQITGFGGGRDFSEILVELSWTDDIEPILPPTPQTPAMEHIKMNMEGT